MTLNKKRRTGLIILLFLLAINTRVGAQDIHFSQFYMNPLQQNPAAAGAKYAMEANLNYKDQWRSIGSPYKTFSMGYHMRFDRKRNSNGYLAAGVSFYTDKAGDSNMGTGKGGLSIAYHLKVNENNRIGAAIQGGYYQRKIEYNNLTWASQYDGQTLNPTYQAGLSGSAAMTNFDLGAGFNWVYNNTGGDIKVTGNNDFNFNIGVAAFHLTRPTYSYTGLDERLPIRFVAHGSGVYSLPGTNWAVVPGFMYYNQGPAQEIYFGTLFRYMLSQNSKFTGLKNGAAIYGGAYFRTKDAITAKMLLEYANWTFGVSYDVNISGLNIASNYRGGIEFSLRFVAPNPFGNGGSINNSRY